MPYLKSALTSVLLFALCSNAAWAARAFTAWEEFDRPHPVCERPIPLSVGQESFFEVANPVLGRDEYNELISLYRARKWDLLLPRIKEFQERFENTPLREAVAFLEIQAMLDKESGKDEAREKEIERRLRSLLLLYPNSDFGPILSAAAGSYWLRTKSYQRSLSIYEMAANTYPHHDLGCTFRLGIAETHFMLRQWQEAKNSFDHVLSKCQNFRLRAAAEIRVVDIDYFQEKNGIEKEYEKVLFNNNPFIERFYQPTLANIGELKYQAGKWSEAKHFFERYLKIERADTECIPWAMKRLADISFRTNDKTGLTIGKYLAAYEKSPKTDVGHFCHAHGLLMDPSLTVGPEMQRRIRLVDMEVEGVQDEDLRSRIYLEKGITLLDVGEATSLSYLARLRGQTPFDFEKGKTGEFVRGALIRLIESGKLLPLQQKNILDAIEEEYATWLKGTPEADWAFKFYATTVGKQVAELVQKGDLGEAVARMAKWRASPLWKKQQIQRSVQDKIAYELLKVLLNDGKDGENALLLSESHSILKAILEPRYMLVTQLAGTELGAPRKKGGWLRWERDLAALSAEAPHEKKGILQLASARLLRLQGDFPGAQNALKGVQDPDLQKLVRREKIEIALGQGKPQLAYSILKDGLAKADAQQKLDGLRQMRTVVADHKVWDRAVDLLSLAKPAISDREELGSFYHLAGKGLFETKHYKEAIPVFENAFRMAPNSVQTAESRFQLGQCWLNEKKPEAARQEWLKVVDLKDSFWSPLAQSELKLLTP